MTVPGSVATRPVSVEPVPASICRARPKSRILTWPPVSRNTFSGLEIFAVDDPLSVRGREATCDLTGDFQGLTDRPGAGAEAVAKRLAFERKAAPVTAHTSGRVVRADVEEMARMPGWDNAATALASRSKRAVDPDRL